METKKSHSLFFRIKPEILILQQLFEYYFFKSLKHLIFIIIFSIYLNSNAQSELNKEYSSDDIENIIDFNPIQSLDIAQLMLSKPNISNKDKARLIFLIYKAHKAKGNYGNAIKFLYEENKYEPYLSEKDKIDIKIEKVILLRELSMHKQSLLLLNELEKNLEIISDVKLKSYLKTAIWIEKAKNFLIKFDVKNGLKYIQNPDQPSKSTINEFPKLKIRAFIVMGAIYFQNQDLDKSKYNFDLAIEELNNLKSKNLYSYTLATSLLAEVYILKNEFQEAIKLLDLAYLDAKKLNNVFLLEMITMRQHDVYLTLNDSENYIQKSKSFIKYESQSDSIMQEAIDNSYELISNEKTDKYSEKEIIYHYILYFLISIFIIVIIFYMFLRRKYSEKYRNLDEIIKYIEITRSRILTVLPVKKQEIKKNVVSKELEDEILKKLKQFENNNQFVNKDISLSILAVQFDTNVKYLSDIINSNYNLNFNTYINTLRINFIIEKLKTDPNFKNYKISYLAYSCGFSAHSSFAKVFKTITGISPVKFIELLKNEKENTLLQDA